MQDRVDVSVIVPARNVEVYVGELLEDLTNQRFMSYEVILVNDGSTDQTPDILREACRRNPRFRLIQTSGVGPGAARNAGVERAVGRYLAFVDADDRIDPDHLALLHHACEEHQLPFAMCSGERLQLNRRFPSAVYRRPFSPPVPATTHITRRHVLLYDTTMTNKLIDRDFWLRNVGGFPEGMLHEDLRPSVQLHLAASSVAMVNKRSYLWRVRAEGERSITQGRGSLEALEGRIRALAEIHQLLGAFGDPALMEAFLLRAVRFDLGLQLKYSAVHPDAYFQRLREAAAHYLDLAGAHVLDHMKLDKRSAYALLFAGSTSALRAVAPRMLGKRPSFHVEPRRTLTTGVTLRAVPNEEVSISRRDRRALKDVPVRASDTAPWAILNTATFDAGELQLTGYLGLQRLVTTTPWLQVAVVASAREGKLSVDAPAQINWRPDKLTRPDTVTQGICGAFEAIVPVHELLPRTGKGATFNIHVEITFAPGYHARSRIRVPPVAAERLTGSAHHSRDHAVYPYVTKRGNLSIKVRPRRYVAVTLVQPDATGWPKLVFDGPRDDAPNTATARTSDEEEHELPVERDGDGFVVDLAPLADGSTQTGELSFIVADRSGRSPILGIGPPQRELESKAARFVLFCDRRGLCRVQIRRRTHTGEVADCAPEQVLRLDEPPRTASALQ